MASSSTHTMGNTVESSDPQSTLVHSRNLSTVSSVTLHTNTTLHSQPYEPLLRPITSGSGEYYDVISHQSRHSDRILALPRWSPSNVLSSRNPSVVNEKGYLESERRPRKRTANLRWIKTALQILMATWSIYSTVRYLLAFTIYQGVTGQAFALGLGAATGLSFAFVSCACILSMTQTTLLLHGISVHAIMSLHSTLYYLSSCCFLGPSIVNFVLIFVWKKTPDLELQTRHRCRLDADLVWSTTYSLCNHRNRTWGSWVAISVFRLLVSLAIVIAFHLIASSSEFKPVRRHSKARYPKGNKKHSRLESDNAPLMAGRSNSSVVVPCLHREPMLQHQSSDSTLPSKSSPRNRLRNSRSQSSTNSEDGNQNHLPLYNSVDYLPMKRSDVQESDRDMVGFVDRFRQLISQVTRETEEGLAFARSDASSSKTIDSDHPSGLPEPETDHDYDACANHYDNGGHEDDFYAPVHTVEVNDYQQAYPEDEHVRMMNGYVKRMPTIESMGSRELVDSLGASSINSNRDCRPPTRNTLWSFGAESEFSGSEARSRPESLSAQAELMVGMFGRVNASEVGELMHTGDTIRMVDSQSANDDGSEALGEGVGNGYASTTTGSQDSKDSIDSKGAQSFHTASIGTASTMSLRTALADASTSPLPVQTPPVNVLPYPQGFGRRSLDIQRLPPSSHTDRCMSSNT